MLPYVEKGIIVVGGMKFAYQVTLKWGDLLTLSRWVQCNHMDLFFLKYFFTFSFER